MNENMKVDKKPDMPAKKSGGMKVGMGGSKTPASVMGSQGKPAPLMLDHFRNKPTGHTKFPSK